MKNLITSLIVLLLTLSASAQKYVSGPYLSPSERLNNQYCSGLFQNADGTIFDVANANSARGYLNIVDWLQVRVVGLEVYRQQDGTAIPFIRNSKAGIYLDEMLVDPSALSMIAVSDIAIIKVIKGTAAGIFGNSGGIIAIYTLKGDEPAEGDEAGS